MIPLDIFDNILGFLDDHRSLISCLKAHPLLSNLVKRHFFVHICLRNFASSESESQSNGPPFFNHTQLYNILSTEPHIANYIRTLYIELRAPYNNENRAEAYHETSLILASLPLLHKIVLYPNLEKPLKWDDLDESFNNALKKCIQLPTLKKIVVAISTFPVKILGRSKSLDELSLLCDIESSLGRIPVDTLRLYGCSSSGLALLWAVGQVDCRIRSLIFINSHEGDLITLSLMPIDTLKELTLDLSRSFAFDTHYNISNKTFTYPTTDYPLGFSLAKLPNLEHLTIHILIDLHEWQNDRHCSYSLPTAVQLLRTLTCPPLKHLILQVTIQLAQSFTIHDINWSPLTDLASLHFRSPVQLSVSVEDYTPINLDDVAQTLNENVDLSSLIKPGLLSINVVSLHPDPRLMFF